MVDGMFFHFEYFERIFASNVFNKNKNKIVFSQNVPFTSI